MREDEDNIRLDPRLTRIGLQALSAVSDQIGVDFFTLSLDHKKEFLAEHGAAVVETAKRAAGPLARYFENRMVALVENGEAAGLYFMKVKPHG